MRTKEITLYTFEELSERAKERARDWWRSLATNDLIDSVEDDEYFTELYKEAGYTFKHAYWDIGRGWHYSPENLDYTDLDTCLKAVGIKDRFNLCETYLMLDRTNSRHGNYRWDIHYSASEHHKRSYAFLQRCVESLNEKLKDLEHRALKAIRDQDEYLSSNEYIDDMLVANEYEFTEDGKLA